MILVLFVFGFFSDSKSQKNYLLFRVIGISSKLIVDGIEGMLVEGTVRRMRWDHLIMWE